MLAQEDSGGQAASLAELKAYLRMGGSDDDALLSALLRGAAALCEQFLGQWLIARDARETVPASSVWTRLTARPVEAIDRIEAIDAQGTAVEMATGAYAIDIDAAGDGWVRVIDANGAAMVRVHYRAGMAGELNGLPEAIRQGIVRLAAEQHAGRTGDNVAPPAAVTALWRPWRRMRIA
ncbi:MAG: phage head-tail connector protein [Sphingobium sp.]